MVKRQFQVFLLVLSVYLGFSVQQLQAQSFLSCTAEPSDDALGTKHLFEPRGEIRSLLHALVGDDDHAFLGANLLISEFKSESLNAFSLAPNRIFLTTGLLRMISSSSELAFVLAHEMAHLRQERKNRKMFLNGENIESDDYLLFSEINADLEASKMLSEAKLDSYVGATFLRRINELTVQRSERIQFFKGLETRILALETLTKTVPPD